MGAAAAEATVVTRVSLRNAVAADIAADTASEKRAGATGLEPAASGLTGQRDNQLRHAPVSVNVAAGIGTVNRPGSARNSRVVDMPSGLW